MNKDQWTVVGLLVALAALEIIRSQAVQSFFSGFFGRFSVGSSSSSSSSSAPGPSGQPLPTQGGGATQQGIKGFPTPGGYRPS